MSEYNEQKAEDCSSSSNSNNISNSNSSEVKLKKGINLFTGCAIIIGNIVGSGIFITSNGVLAETKSPGLALIVWIVSGLFSLIGAYCYTELGTLIQTSGGDYAYINESYGRMVSFLYTYMMIFVTVPCLNAVFGMTVGVYIVKIFFSSCDPPEFLPRIISALTIMLLCMVNMTNVKVLSRIQAAFTITKVFALLIIIVLGIYHFCVGPVKTHDLLTSWFDTNEFKFNGLAMAMCNGLYSYSGWNCLNFLTEEMKNPAKNLPRAIFISLPFITVIYVITNVAYFLVLSPAEMISSAAVALTFSEKTMGFLSFLTPLFISFSTFGALSGSILGFSRIYYAAARDGNLPQCFALINVKSFTPVTCIILQSVMSLLMLSVKNIDTLIFFGTFSEMFFIAIALSSIFYFRVKRPNANRPIKVNICFPIIFMLICLFLTIITILQKPVETGIGLLLMASCVPIYVVGVLWKNKPPRLNKFLDNLTLLCQKMFLSVKED